MYRIREIDGQDDDIADTLTELHRLTFFDDACIPEFDRGIGGSRFTRACRSPSPASFRQRAPAVPDISAGLAC
jgi:hypothetical protein